MTSTASARPAPFYLRGNFAPVSEELTAFDLSVEGALPPELSGLYLRNGPNPRAGNASHWFLGDGMLHGLRLEAGRASWYRNRWVRTRAFEEGATLVGADGSIDRSVAVANTHVIRHASRILALVESSFPTEVGSELETRGSYDFDGRLTTAMTAHPKLCPLTGELHFFGYSFAPPFLTYHRADADGKLVQSEEIDLPAPSMLHDFAITERHVIFMDLPILFDAEQVMRGEFPYRWSDDHAARLGVMPRDGGAADLRWLEVEPCYVFHALNAFDDGDRIVMDVARYPDLWREGPNAFSSAFLHRWTLDPAAGSVGEQRLDDRTVEFPRIDERLCGRPHRYGYAVENLLEGTATPDAVTTRLLRYDLEGGGSTVHDFGPGRAAGEAVFVAASPEAAEDEGWLLSFVYDASRAASELVVLDASRLDAAPVARVPLPQRVPFGFHGSWLPDPL